VHKDSTSDVEGCEFRASLKDSETILNARSFLTSRGSAEFKSDVTSLLPYQASYLAKDFGVGGSCAFFVAGVNMGQRSTFIPGTIDFFGNFLGTGWYIRIGIFV
jgi:hypothetical protein